MPLAGCSLLNGFDPDYTTLLAKSKIPVLHRGNTVGLPGYTPKELQNRTVIFNHPDGVVAPSLSDILLLYENKTYHIRARWVSFDEAGHWQTQLKLESGFRIRKLAALPHDNGDGSSGSFSKRYNPDELSVHGLDYVVGHMKTLSLPHYRSDVFESEQAGSIHVRRNDGYVVPNQMDIVVHNPREHTATPAHVRGISYATNLEDNGFFHTFIAFDSSDAWP